MFPYDEYYSTVVVQMSSSSQCILGAGMSKPSPVVLSVPPVYFLGYHIMSICHPHVYIL